MVVTAERAGMSALVRLRGHDPPTANMFFDAGASGVLVPHCSPYETAQQLITDMVFPPLVGAAPAAAAAPRSGASTAPRVPSRRRHGVVRVPMIEDPEPSRTSTAFSNPRRRRRLHRPGRPDPDARRPRRGAGTGRPSAGRVRGQRHPGRTTAYGDDVEARLRQGFKWLAVANDTGPFTRAIQQRLGQVRQVIAAIR